MILGVVGSKSGLMLEMQLMDELMCVGGNYLCVMCEW